LTDIKNNKFYYTERYARGDLKIAGAKLNPLKVWLENWSLEQIDENTFKIKAEHENVKIAFTLNNLKPIVLNGNRGMSQKSSEQGNASYYYSMTRMETKGNISINKENFNVSGFSWFDREWSTSSLNKKQTGWDWFSLQLNNNRELMLYELRLKDGTTDPFSSGTYIDEKGNSFHLKKEDFKIEVLEHWKSISTNITYPSKWKILVPKYNLEFIAEPHQSNQELLNSFIYWEGAVKLSGKDIIGNGYIELTGYK
jgi:predicted secreted hydrolase